MPTSKNQRSRKKANQALQLQQLANSVARNKGGGKKEQRRQLSLGGLVGNLASELSPTLGNHINNAAGNLLKSIIPEIGMLFPTSGGAVTAQLQSRPMAALPGITQVSAPSANGAIVVTPSPQTTTIKDGVRVVHRELLTTIFAPTDQDFSIAFLGAINPGNREVFPWLASMGRMYDFYKFNSLRFIYEPVCTVENPGSIMMAVDFDPVDDPPLSDQQILSYACATQSSPWIASVNTSPQTYLNKKLNTAGAVSPPNTDPKTYYIGNIYVAVDNSTSPVGTPLGKVFVEYSVDLTIPNKEYLGSEQFFLVGYSDNGDTYSKQVSAFGSLFVNYDPNPVSGNVFINNPFFINTPGLYEIQIYWRSPTPNDNPWSAVITPVTGTTVYSTFKNNQGLVWADFGYTYDLSTIQFERRWIYFTDAPGGFSVDYPQSNIDANVYMSMIITPADSQLLPFLGILPLSAATYRLKQARRARGFPAIEKLSLTNEKDSLQPDKFVEPLSGEASTPSSNLSHIQPI